MPLIDWSCTTNGIKLYTHVPCCTPHSHFKCCKCSLHDSEVFISTAPKFGQFGQPLHIYDIARYTECMNVYSTIMCMYELLARYINYIRSRSELDIYSYDLLMLLVLQKLWTILCIHDQELTSRHSCVHAPAKHEDMLFTTSFCSYLYKHKSVSQLHIIIIYSQMIDACHIIYINLFACIKYIFTNVQQIHLHMYICKYTSIEKLDPGIQDTAMQKSEVRGTYIAIGHDQ